MLQVVDGYQARAVERLAAERTLRLFFCPPSNAVPTKNMTTLCGSTHARFWCPEVHAKCTAQNLFGDGVELERACSERRLSNLYTFLIRCTLRLFLDTNIFQRNTCIRIRVFEGDHWR